MASLPPLDVAQEVRKLRLVAWVAMLVMAVCTGLVIVSLRHASAPPPERRTVQIYYS